jgi:3-hydroxyisobutyrate dehydrogenase
VSGSLPQAQGKELVIMVGGDQAAFDKAQPVLAGMGRLVRRIGDVGSGATLKLINNMLGASLQAVLAEGALVAEAANLDRAATMEILNEGASGSRVVKNKLPKMFSRDFSPQFHLELMDKDVRYFLQLASELDRPAPVAALVRSQFQAARRVELGKLDSSAVFLYAAGEKAK